MGKEFCRETASAGIKNGNLLSAKPSCWVLSQLPLCYPFLVATRADELPMIKDSEAVQYVGKNVEVRRCCWNSEPTDRMGEKVSSKLFFSSSGIPKLHRPVIRARGQGLSIRTPRYGVHTASVSP